MSLGARLVLLAILCAAAAGAWWRITVHYEARGYQRAQAEARDAMEAQRQRNIDLQRTAEKRYTVQAEVREQFIVETVTEVRNATDNLAGCVLRPDAVRRLHDAAACARADPAASCGPGEPVRGPP